MKFFEYKFDIYTTESLRKTFIKQTIKWVFMLIGLIIGAILLDGGKANDKDMIFALLIAGWWVLPTVIKYVFFASVGSLAASDEYYQVNYDTGRVTKHRDYSGSLLAIIFIFIFALIAIIISIVITPFILLNRLIQLILIQCVIRKRKKNGEY